MLTQTAQRTPELAVVLQSTPAASVSIGLPFSMNLVPDGVNLVPALEFIEEKLKKEKIDMGLPDICLNRYATPFVSHMARILSLKNCDITGLSVRNVGKLDKFFTEFTPNKNMTTLLFREAKVTDGKNFVNFLKKFEKIEYLSLEKVLVLENSVVFRDYLSSCDHLEQIIVSTNFRQILH